MSKLKCKPKKTLNLPKLAVLAPESADQKHVIEVYRLMKVTHKHAVDKISSLFQVQIKNCTQKKQPQDPTILRYMVLHRYDIPYFM